MDNTRISEKTFFVPLGFGDTFLPLPLARGIARKGGDDTGLSKDFKAGSRRFKQFAKKLNTKIKTNTLFAKRVFVFIALQLPYGGLQ